MSLEDRLYPLLRAYESLPLGLRRLAGRVYRAVPRRVRLGRHFAEFERLATEGQTWSRAEVEAYQFKELRKTLFQAASYCPFYERTFAEAGFHPERMKDFDGLVGCPFTSKDDLLQHLPQMTSRSVPSSARLYITTGGSTGVPVGFYLHKGISRPKEQAFWEMIWSRAGYWPGARVAVVRGHVTTTRATGRIDFYDAARDWLLLSSSHLTDERMPEYLEAIERFAPDLLHAYPSAALQMASFLERHGQSWRVPLKGLLCGSERLTLPQKRILERTFGCRVYRWYGHSERVVLAGEGARGDLYYFVPQYGYVEFGPPDEDGLQEVIGTSFHNMAMPLIRYRTGDRVRLAAPERDGPLEWDLPAAVDIAGRDQEFLVSGSGRRISLTAFNMHDGVFDDLYAVQFYQEQPGEVEFRYVSAPGFRESRLAAIEAGVKRKLGDDFVVRLRPVKETERTGRGKHKWLVSRLGGVCV